MSWAGAGAGATAVRAGVRHQNGGAGRPGTRSGALPGEAWGFFWPAGRAAAFRSAYAAIWGIDPHNREAVREFDRQRPKQMSNEDCGNPHEPDAKIGPTKAGGTDRRYKPEHTVDLATGAILQAEVRLGQEPDHKDLARV